MALSLVQYSDSDSDDPSSTTTTTQPPPKAAAAPPSSSSSQINSALKRKRNSAEPAPNADLPPLPAQFHDLYSTAARISTSDDPSLHGGRKRAVPHIEGRWPTHVYLEWYPSIAEAENIQHLIDSVHEAFGKQTRHRPRHHEGIDITSSLRSPLGAPLPLHISLSRTLQIPTDDRDTFLETITRCVRKTGVEPFGIIFSRLRWVSNYERNRWFLVLGIRKPEHDELNMLLDACNDAAEKTGNPCLYKGTVDSSQKADDADDRKAKRRGNIPLKASPVEKQDRTDAFHISIASTLTEPPAEYNVLLQTWDLDKDVISPKDPFRLVKIKMGNAIHNIELRTKKTVAEKGLGLFG